MTLGSQVREWMRGRLKRAYYCQTEQSATETAHNDAADSRSRDQGEQREEGPLEERKLPLTLSGTTQAKRNREMPKVYTKSDSGVVTYWPTEDEIGFRYIDASIFINSVKTYPSYDGDQFYVKTWRGVMNKIACEVACCIANPHIKCVTVTFDESGVRPKSKAACSKPKPPVRDITKEWNAMNNKIDLDAPVGIKMGELWANKEVRREIIVTLADYLIKEVAGRMHPGQKMVLDGFCVGQGHACGCCVEVTVDTMNLPGMPSHSSSMEDAKSLVTVINKKVRHWSREESEAENVVPFGTGYPPGEGEIKIFSHVYKDIEQEIDMASKKRKSASGALLALPLDSRKRFKKEVDHGEEAEDDGLLHYLEEPKTKIKEEDARRGGGGERGGKESVVSVDRLKTETNSPFVGMVDSTDGDVYMAFLLQADLHFRYVDVHDKTMRLWVSNLIVRGKCSVGSSMLEDEVADAKMSQYKLSIQEASAKGTKAPQKPRLKRTEYVTEYVNLCLLYDELYDKLHPYGLGAPVEAFVLISMLEGNDCVNTLPVSRFNNNINVFLANVLEITDLVAVYGQRDPDTKTNTVGYGIRVAPFIRYIRLIYESKNKSYKPPKGLGSIKGSTHLQRHATKKPGSYDMPENVTHLGPFDKHVVEECPNDEIYEEQVKYLHLYSWIRAKDGERLAKKTKEAQNSNSSSAKRGGQNGGVSFKESKIPDLAALYGIMHNLAYGLCYYSNSYNPNYDLLDSLATTRDDRGRYRSIYGYALDANNKPVTTSWVHYSDTVVRCIWNAPYDRKKDPTKREPCTHSIQNNFIIRTPLGSY